MSPCAREVWRPIRTYAVLVSYFTLCLQVSQNEPLIKHLSLVRRISDFTCRQAVGFKGTLQYRESKTRGNQIHFVWSEVGIGNPISKIISRVVPGYRYHQVNKSLLRYSRLFYKTFQEHFIQKKKGHPKFRVSSSIKRQNTIFPYYTFTPVVSFLLRFYLSTSETQDLGRQGRR